MLGISLVLLFLFFSSLNWLTNHGRQITVPVLMGQPMQKAIDRLEDMGFRVEIDSTYKAGKKPLEVLFQEPESGMSVKYGRTVFLTINRKTPPSIEMPNLVNMSFRNALLTLKSYYLEMGDTSYRPDVAAGAVLEQWLNGKPLLPGTLVPFGTKIDLVVGEGLSGEVDVPNLVGLRWDEVRTILDSLQLSPNPLWEGSITDSNSAIVYMQQPEAYNELDFRNSIPQGDMIDIRIQQNPSAELLQMNQPGSKKLTGDGSDSAESGVPVAPSPPRPAPAPSKEKTDTIKKPKMIPGTFMHQTSPAKTASGSTNKTESKTVPPKKNNTVNTNTPSGPVNKTPKADKPKPAEKKPEPFNSDYN